jgi:hypothetical protein
MSTDKRRLDAMAAAFTENGIRVTPGGIFQGRDVIRRDLQEALNMGLQDYAVRRTVSRLEGNFVFNAGDWQAKLGNKPFTAITPRSLLTALFVSHATPCPLMALNVIHGAAKVWSLSDQQRTNCAVGLDWLRSV